MTSYDPRIAQRIHRLGTETAYSVALDAAAVAQSGRKVHNMHIGDLNLPTPACIKDACVAALHAGKTGYCPAAGIPALRTAMAAFYNEHLGRDIYQAEHVSVQSGGKPLIGKFLMAVMDPGCGVLYPNPGYPIYESQIDFHGGVPHAYTFVQKDGSLSLDLDALEALVISTKSRIVILNNYQNPTGYALSAEEMERFCALCVSHDLLVFSDDPYFELRYDGRPLVHCLQYPEMADRTLCAYTFSKAFSMTGWRLGAGLGPTWLTTWITKLNTNDEACTTHFVQEAGVVALTHPASRQFTQDMVVELTRRRDALLRTFGTMPGMTAFVPASTFYLWLCVDGAARRLGVDTAEAFRVKVLQGCGLSFTTRDHFGHPNPDESSLYIRLAFSSVTVAEIEAAAQDFAAFMDTFP